MLNGSENISGKKAFTGVDKFISRRPTFRSGTQKMGSQNQSARPTETQLETCSFHFSSASIESFCNEAFVDWMLF